jgi:hypothetical protein
MTADLATAAVTVAVNAAWRRLYAIGWTPAEVRDDSEALAAAVNAAVRAAIPAALADARAAIEAGMPQAAEETFRASCAIAGIEAANRHHAATRGELVTA